jgi:hypothetical protein
VADGPVLSLPFNPGIANAVGSVGERAKLARLEVKRLSEQMVDAQAQGKKLSQVSVQALKTAQGQLTELKKIQDEQKELLHGFHTFHQVQRFAGRGLTSLFHGDVVGTTESLLASRSTARLAAKLGMGDLSEKLMMTLPAAFLAREGFEALDRWKEKVTEDRISKEHVTRQFIEGHMTKETFDTAMNIGKWYDDLNPFGEGAAAKRNKFIESAKGLKMDSKVEQF